MYPELMYPELMYPELMYPELMRPDQRAPIALRRSTGHSEPPAPQRAFRSS
jgi:hypothetical protein